jgi:PAS domain S-box-containing protein
MQENLLAAIVESSDDAIVSKNLDGIILSWNRGAERLFGYTSAEAVGKSIAIIIPSDRLDEEAEILKRLQCGERIENFETIRARKGGNQLNVSLTISPVRDASGRIVGASKVARDVTEQVQQRKALHEANADLQLFAHSASHDLQETLWIVRTYSELLQRRFGGHMGQEGDELIKRIVEGTMQLEALLIQLRNYTQVSARTNEVPEEIDANETLKKVLANLEMAIRDTSASVTSTTLPRLRLHQFQLELLFQNLIGNAIKYHGDDPPHVHIAVLRQDKEWLFSVQDNGVGIEPEYKEKVFGLFKRLHSAGTHPGSGMGLAICQRIVERAGGRIWVESEPGKGSTFYFAVPDGNL